MIYKPEGVCAQLLNLDIEDGIVKSVEFIGGCAGNTQGLASLVKGMPVDDVIEILPYAITLLLSGATFAGMFISRRRMAN